LGKYRFDRYVNITVRRDLYEKLRKLADEKNVSVPDLIAFLLSEYLDFRDFIKRMGWEEPDNAVKGK